MLETVDPAVVSAVVGALMADGRRVVVAADDRPR